MFLCGGSIISKFLLGADDHDRRAAGHDDGRSQRQSHHRDCRQAVHLAESQRHRGLSRHRRAHCAPGSVDRPRRERRGRHFERHHGAHGGERQGAVPRWHAGGTHQRDGKREARARPDGNRSQDLPLRPARHRD